MTRGAGRSRPAWPGVLAVWAVWTTALSGCSGFWQWMSAPNGEELTTTVSAYCKYISYRDYDSAKAFIVRKDKMDFSRYFANAGDRLRIESYNLEESEIHEDETAPPGWEDVGGGNPPPPSWAKVLVMYRYVLLPSNTVQTTMQEQIWIAVEGEWMLLFPSQGPGF